MCLLYQIQWILTCLTLTPSQHFSGVEVLGSEYSFASGGGIFESTPKEAAGAIFREQVELGVFQGGSSEIQTIVSDLREEWSPTSYNLIRKNCNHFANAFVYALLGRTIPAHVNRLADIGVCCSCLLPKQMLEEAPVGDPNAGSSGGDSSGGFQVFNAPGRSSGSADHVPTAPAFGGSGVKLGSDDSGSASTSFFGGSANKGKDDLTDRREKARKAALARLERKDENCGDTSGKND
mmetsp:Transcript_18781/g.25048  ORF Transcript_18781/g.25048 Transcript_18781/m.25048 type:complete len:236 (+) Transcript_18781:440-1147(+)